MLKSITLENFKAFKCLNNLEIKPITILCGANSCGKSSILESILLLKQTIESRNKNQALLFNGKYVRLGTFENVIYEQQLKNELNLKFQFNLNHKNYRSREANRSPFVLLLRRLVLPGNINSKAEHIINYNITLINENKERSYGFNNQMIVKKLCFDIKTNINNESFPGAKVEIKLQEGTDRNYELSWENIISIKPTRLEKTLKGSAKKIKVEFINLIPVGIGVISSEEEKKLPFEIYNVFHSLNEILQAVVGSITYLGPLREEPSRRYIYEDDVVEIGVKGENAAYLYMSEYYNLLKNHYFYNETSNVFNLVEECTLNQALTEWFDLMHIKGFKPELNNGIIYLNVNSESDQIRINIADVGFGVSQIFPLLLEGLRMPKGNSLVLEQPEIHLHPNLQMQMADYFICLALSGKNIIAETHSDHIINRLVRRIVEDEDYNLKDLINIYFINSYQKGSDFEKIVIDEKKGIVNWPKDFFDQTSLEQEKIMIAGLNKRNKARNKKEI